VSTASLDGRQPAGPAAPQAECGLMWCDDFDADLLKVVPGAAEALGDAGALRLTTYSWLTDGKINCPVGWNTYDGLMAFFWTAEEHRPDRSWLTDAPEAECTLLEAVRDEWVHGCLISIDHQVIWRPPNGLMTRLMYDLRGWTPMTDTAREECREHVRASLRAAAARLRACEKRPATRH
jgi:hypothetical protein